MLDNVFIGGDALRGAATIVKAVGDGRKTAIGICAKAGILLPSEALHSEKNITNSELIIRKTKRINMNPGISGFQAELTGETAREEASRCLLCNEICNICVSVCPNRANMYYKSAAAEIPVWQIKITGNGTHISQSGNLVTKQKIQVLNIADFCNECGNCTTFCPTSGAPFLDKPRFCLTEKSFEQTDNSYLLQEHQSQTILLHRVGDEFTRLIKSAGGYQYSNNKLEADFDPDDFRLISFKLKEDAGTQADFLQAAVMKYLIDNVTAPDLNLVADLD